MLFLMSKSALSRRVKVNFGSFLPKGQKCKWWYWLESVFLGVLNHSQVDWAGVVRAGRGVLMAISSIWSQPIGMCQFILNIDRWSLLGSYMVWNWKLLSCFLAWGLPRYCWIGHYLLSLGVECLWCSRPAEGSHATCIFGVMLRVLEDRM